jgi:hypothetical protein
VVTFAMILYAVGRCSPAAHCAGRQAAPPARAGGIANSIVILLAIRRHQVGLVVDSPALLAVHVHHVFPFIFAMSVRNLGGPAQDRRPRAMVIAVGRRRVPSRRC